MNAPRAVGRGVKRHVNASRAVVDAQLLGVCREIISEVLQMIVEQCAANASSAALVVGDVVVFKRECSRTDVDGAIGQVVAGAYGVDCGIDVGLLCSLKVDFFEGAVDATVARCSPVEVAEDVGQIAAQEEQCCVFARHVEVEAFFSDAHVAIDHGVAHASLVDIGF